LSGGGYAVMPVDRRLCRELYQQRYTARVVPNDSHATAAVAVSIAPHLSSL